MYLLLVSRSAAPDARIPPGPTADQRWACSCLRHGRLVDGLGCSFVLLQLARLEAQSSRSRASSGLKLNSLKIVIAFMCMCSLCLLLTFDMAALEARLWRMWLVKTWPCSCRSYFAETPWGRACHAHHSLSVLMDKPVDNSMHCSTNTIHIPWWPGLSACAFRSD